MSAPQDQNGDGGYGSNKRPLEQSPTQAHQPSLFGTPAAGSSAYGQQPGARTIYSNKPQGFANGGGAMDGGAAGAGTSGQDDYAAVGGQMFAGQRATGMGRQASSEGQMMQQSMNPMTPQDAPRKRLRRGGPVGDDGAEEGPGSFTAGLQSRLDAVHVESGPPSTASSAYGGSASASMAPTPSWNGSMAGDQAAAALAQSQPHPGTPPVGSTMSPRLNNLNQPAYGADPNQNYAQNANSSYQQQQNWQQQQPQGASPATTFSPAASYAAVNQPISTPGAGPGTPGAPPSQPQQQQQAYTPQQLQQLQQQHAIAQQQQQQQRPQIQVVRQQAPAQQGYPGVQQQQQPRMMMGPNGQPVPVPAQYGSQPGGYTPQQQLMARPGQPLTPQQQQQMMAQRAAMAAPPQPGAPGGAPGGAGYEFPPAQVGTANMTQAHVSHYYQLQEAYRRGAITGDEYKQLVQYISVLNKFFAASGRPLPGAGGPPPGQPGVRPGQPYYPGHPGAPNQAYAAQAYSHQGVYAGQPVPGATAYQHGGRVMQMHPHPQMQHPQMQRPPVKPPAPKHQPPLTSGTILARQLAAAAAGNGGATSKKKVVKKKAYNSDSDDDGGDYDSAGSGDEYGTKENPAQIAKREAIAVEFFNQCEKDQLMELAGCNATQATLTMKLRPFASANDFRTRTRKQKGVGNNMMDTYLEVVSGMSEVDKVLSECEQIGRELSSVMQIWASGAAASSTSEATRPGATMANEVGLDLVAISEETIVQRVDTSQDPRVRDAFKDYIRRQPAGVPENIKLKDYQMLGVNWLNLLYKRGTSCILADEMGLGKTAQVIALLAHLKANDPKDGPHLVIVPSSTLDNWMREFSVFAPDLNVWSYYGSQGERAEIRHELRQMEDLDVVVTTYNIATGSPDDQKFLKRKMDFKVCVFDEGHQLKNSDSKKYKDLMQIRAEWRLLLTGTPLQNNLQELVSLLSFILPEQFRDANESLRAIFKVGPGQQTNLLSRERIKRAKSMMTPFVLRRKKAQVLKDLPKKLERIEYCDMTGLQREVYDEAVQRSRKALSGIKDEEELEELGEQEEEEAIDAAAEEVKPKKGRRAKTVAASTKTGNKANTSSSAHVLTDLRKASNHPMLFRRLYDEKKLRLMARDCLKEDEFLDRNKDLIFEDMEVMTDFELHRFCQGYKHLNKYCLTDNEWMSAGKIAKLQELLPDMRKKGDRILIFSQFVQVLDILEVVLDTMEIKYLKLTGQTQVADRQGLVDAFNQNEDITVFLLSTRAGGLGLNLTAANTVIFYDCDYNPHNDKQAEDRAYRIGQTRDVNIIRLVTKNSLDEAMLDLANTKLKLDSEVTGAATSGPATGQTAEGAAGEAADDGGAEKRMKKSLLSGLKKQFELEATQTQAPSQLETVKEEQKPAV
ncbi:hypothetical protein JCM8097_006665 [Rhodosporidiobolus ruineniae]